MEFRVSGSTTPGGAGLGGTWMNFTRDLTHARHVPLPLNLARF